MAEIKMNAAQMTNAGQNMKSQNTVANSALDNITKSLEVLRTSGAWQSDAAIAFFNKFTELRARIERHAPVINQYGDHVIKAAADYQATDSAIQSNVGTINIKRTS